MASLTGSDLKILRYLAVEKAPANKYQIRKNAKAGSQPTVLKAMRKLKENEMIDVVPNPNVRDRRKAIYYDLNRYGLVCLIAGSGDLDQQTMKGIAKNKLMPTIFDFWPEIQEAHAGALACARLRNVFLNLPSNKTDQSKMSSNLADDVFSKFWDPAWPSQKANIKPSAEEWCEVIRGNKKLSERAMQILEKNVSKAIDSAKKSAKLISSLELTLPTSSTVQTMQEQIELLFNIIKTLREEQK
jgi:DNA-binding transcriptional ArsR family regulator